MKFIGDEVSRDSYVNIMAQYRWPREILCNTHGEKYDLEKILF
jgi:hypothetical protein